MISCPNDVHYVHYYVLIIVVNSLYILIPETSEKVLIIASSVQNQKLRHREVKQLSQVTQLGDDSMDLKPSSLDPGACFLIILSHWNKCSFPEFKTQRKPWLV